MSKFILTTVFTLSFCAILFAAGITEKEKSTIRDVVFSTDKLRIKSLDNHGFDKIVNEQLFTVSGNVQSKMSGYGIGYHRVVMIKNKKIISLVNLKLDGSRSSVDRTKEEKLPVLTSSIKKSFKLTTMADAVLLDRFLKFIYPGDSYSRESDFDGVQCIYKKNNQWFFVRAKSWKKYKGFEITIKDDGSISNIRYIYELSTPPKYKKNVLSDVEKLIMAEVKNNFNVTVSAIESDDFKTLFSAKLYKVKAQVSQGGIYSNGIVTKKDGQYGFLKNPNVGYIKKKRLKGLEKIIKSSFTLKKNSDADIIKSALDSIDIYYSKKGITYSNSGKDWTFVIKRISDKSSYTFKTDDKGKITEIWHNPRLK